LSVARGPVISASSRTPPQWASVLDALAGAVFGDARGEERIAPLLARWEGQVGPLREEDPEHATMQAVRVDWALCDAAVDYPGDTWAWRAAQGAIPGVQRTAAIGAVARSISGLWRVTPGRRPWLSDCLSGVGVELASPIRLPNAGGEPLLWDARIVVMDGAAELCRPPLTYPGVVLSEIRRRGLLRLKQPTGVDPDGARVDEASRHSTLLQLRRRWLHCARAPRADPLLLFTHGTVARRS